MEDYQNLIQMFALGAFPWISQLKKLKIHFEIKGFKLASIYNFFASLFSISIFAYCNYSNPYQLISLPSWWVFILISLIFTITYFSIYFFCKEKVESKKIKTPVIFNFINYIAIFCFLTLGFGLLKVYSNYYVIKGEVVDFRDNNLSLSGVQVGIYDNNRKYEQISLTDKDGNFLLLIEKKYIKDYKHLSVSKEGYETLDQVFAGQSSIISFLKNPKLKKLL
ncbi:MAG: hypothetical protein IIC75_03665 [Bacteroidetes bacterium]|nr:hypothetical protein [Bacteroidota bacterium]